MVGRTSVSVAEIDNFYEKKAEKYGRKMAKDYLKINRKNIYK